MNAERKQHQQDFSRPIVIHVCKDGTINYRSKEEKVFNRRALPVFSVDTVGQAKAIQVRFGRCQYGEHPDLPGQLWYRWTDFSGDVADLDECTKACREFYAAIVSRNLLYE